MLYLIFFIMYINDRASKYFVNIVLGLILFLSTCDTSNLSRKEYEPLITNTTRQLNEYQNPEGSFYLKFRTLQ
jgi:hypothetical protein